VLLKQFEQTQSVNDVSWANMMGRSYHLIGVADSAGVKVWKFNIINNRVEMLQ